MGGPHVAPVIHAISACPAGDLLDLLRLELPSLHAVELLCVHEDDPPDGQVQPHADGVGGDHVGHAPGQKALHLFAPGGIRQGAVDDSGLFAGLAQVLGHAEHPHLGKGDQGIPRLDAGVVHGVVHADQGGLALVEDDLIGIPAAFDQPQQQVLGLRGGAQVDLRGQDPQDGPGPSVTPLAVGDHLALVDDRHVVGGFQLQFFRCGGHMGVLLPAVLLLAGGQAAVDPCVQQNLLGLQGQQAQGGQIHAGGGLLEPLKASVGLAGVGAP